LGQKANEVGEHTWEGLQEGAADVDPSSGGADPQGVSRRLMAMLAVAASLVMAVALWLTISDRRTGLENVAQNADKPSADPAPAAPEIRVEKLQVRVSADGARVSRMGGVDPQKFLAAFERAMEPYRKDRFEEAVVELRTVAAAYPRAAEPRLFEGVSLLMLKRGPEAVIALEGARKLAGKGDLARDAAYHHAVALAVAGRPTGRGALQRICETDGPYKMQACQALRSLSPPRR
jgi:cytochrome c-type biogenesis protein CcmH/NrfG